MSWRQTKIFRKRFTNEMSLQNIKERKSPHKILPKTSKFGINLFNFSKYYLFFFLYSFVMYSSKSRYGAKRRNEKQRSDAEKRKQSTRILKKKKKDNYGEKQKHAVHERRINAHKYKSSNRQIAQIKDK